MTVLLALQGALPRSARRAGPALARAGARRWLYAGEDGAWRLRAQEGPLARLEPVALGERLGRLAEELRGPYLDWIGELSQQNAGREWWASQLAAKNPYTWLYSRICALAAVREALADGTAGRGTLIVCSTPALLAETAAHARALGLPVHVRWPGSAGARRARAAAERLAWRGLGAFADHAPGPLRAAPARAHGLARFTLDRTPGHRRRTLAELGATRNGNFAGEDTALLVTWVDERSFAPDGAYRDPHFGPLAEFLRGRGLRVALLPRVLPTAPFADCARRLLAADERFFAPELWLDAADWRVCDAAAKAFAPEIPAAAAIGGVPVARLAAEHVAEHRRSQADALTYEPMVRNLAAAGVRPRRVVIPWEGHSWEQVLTGAVHEHLPGSEVVAYDNLNFSRFALSLYPARTELGLRPLPDRVVTNGAAFREVLAGEGFPPERIRVGCALRHGYLYEREPEASAPPRAPDAPLRVLVASSIDLAQAVELVGKALAAFGGDARYDVTIKLHPAVDATRVRAATRSADGHANVRFAAEPIGGLLERADLMLYTYSVVCYEALAHGVPAVFVRSETFLDLDQLEPFPELRLAARTPQELRARAEEVRTTDPERRAAWRAQAAAAVRAALTPPAEGCVEAFL